MLTFLLLQLCDTMPSLGFMRKLNVSFIAEDRMAFLIACHMPHLQELVMDDSQV